MRTELKVMPSLQRKIDGLKALAEQQVERKLIDMAVDAVGLGTMRVPVDTGAYVTSFSFNVGAGRPRGKSSKNKPRRQSPQQKAAEGRENLQKDIDKLPDLVNKEAVQLRNEAPHAQMVEDKHGYKVFAKVRREYG